MFEFFNKSIALILFLLAVTINSINCSSSQIMGEPFYSPKSKKLYNELIRLSEKSNWTNLNTLVSEEMKKEYGITMDAGEMYVGSKLRINEMYYADELWSKGIKVGTRINEIVTVRIPLFAFTSLEEIEGIEYVEIDSEIKLRTN